MTALTHCSRVGERGIVDVMVTAHPQYLRNPFSCISCRSCRRCECTGIWSEACLDVSERSDSDCFDPCVFLNMNDNNKMTRPIDSLGSTCWGRNFLRWILLSCLHLCVTKSDHLGVLYVHVAASNAASGPLPASILAKSRPIDAGLSSASLGQLGIASVNNGQLCISLQTPAAR